MMMMMMMFMFMLMLMLMSPSGRLRADVSACFLSAGDEASRLEAARKSNVYLSCSGARELHLSSLSRAHLVERAADLACRSREAPASAGALMRRLCVCVRMLKVVRSGGKQRSVALLFRAKLQLVVRLALE